MFVDQLQGFLNEGKVGSNSIFKPTKRSKKIEKSRALCHPKPGPGMEPDHDDLNVRRSEVLIAVDYGANVRKLVTQLKRYYYLLERASKI